MPAKSPGYAAGAGREIRQRQGPKRISSKNKLVKVEYEAFEFTAYNCIIRGEYILPPEPKGIVVVVHGFGEHSARYKEKVVPALLKAALAVVLYDNIGHGRSGGKRGHCPGYQALLTILEVVIDNAMTILPGAPLILYGHSMGGNLALNYALKMPVRLKAIVASSPYLRLAFAPPKWKLLLGSLMLRLYPSFTLPAGIDPAGISTIPAEVEKYRNDPLIHNKVSPMYGLPIMQAGKQAISLASNLGIPAMLLHGTADPIIDPEGSREFHKKATTTSLKMYPGAYHELHNDFCAADVLDDIQNWLRQQL